VIPRIVTTPIGPSVTPRAGTPRRVSEGVLASILPGPARDRLAREPVVVVTTGQQPGLFTGPLYTVYKALTAIAWARRLERERGVAVVPIFWVAGDDHDFEEANHVTFLNASGEAVKIVLRERPEGAPSLSSWREPCGPEIAAALGAVRDGTPASEFKAAVLDWLAAAYRPDATLADAFAAALQALLGEHGLAVLRPYTPAVKQEMAPWLVRGLDLPLDDGLSPVLVEASLGRDRLRPEGKEFVTRRSGERFTRADLERIAQEAPERLSPNVLLRPVVEAALLPTVAYFGGPGELQYLPDAARLYTALGVTAQTPAPRWSGVLIESRVDRVLDKHGLSLEDLGSPPGVVEGRLVREQLPPEVTQALEGLRSGLSSAYGRVSGGVTGIDATLERTVESARNAALGAANDIEKKVVAALKRANETLVNQVARARTAVFPDGAPQERVLTYASMAIRYGTELLAALEDEVARWTAGS
jgi:bacillithiol synthase